MVHTTTARLLAAAAALLLAGGLAGCTEMSGASSKAGGDPEPITLTMGTDDASGRPAAEQIDEFARQVEERSGGSLLIEPRYQAAGLEQPAWDQKVARLVVDGDLDLGMIPARAWDSMGVDTLRALFTPFLVTSDVAMDDVTTDDELATDLMAGLEDVGVTGLALVPEALRHLFLYGDTTLGADGLRGEAVRAPRSETTYAFFEALGGRPTDSSGPGDWTVAESSYAQAPQGVSRTALGDVTLFPKINVVAANSAMLADLTDEQRSVLQDAALATRDWAVANNPTDEEQAAAWCEDGAGDVARAGEDLVADLRAGARPVIEDLRADASTAALVARIAGAASGAPAPHVEPCRAQGRGGAAAAMNLDPTGGDLPDGTYRAEYTDDYLRDRVRSQQQVFMNHGVWTFHLRDGAWDFDQVAPDITDHEQGAYEVRGDDLYWKFEDGTILHLRWWTDEDGDLHFDQYRDFGADANADYPFPDFQFGVEWVRVK